jgi:hypothetical protein
MAQSVAEETISAEEYTVYSVLIKARYGADQAELVVIRAQTLPALAEDAGILTHLRPAMPELTPELVADFVAKNRRSYPLMALLDTQIRHTYISEEEEHDLFQAEGGWHNFYLKYPDSREMMSFSRVGFSPQLDMGLVCIGYQLGPLAGGGDYILLKKQDGVWVEEKRAIAWMA